MPSLMKAVPAPCVLDDLIPLILFLLSWSAHEPPVLLGRVPVAWPPTYTVSVQAWHLQLCL